MKTSSFSHIWGTDTTLLPNRLHLRCTCNSPVLQSAWQAYHSPLLLHTLVNVIINNNNCWQQLTCCTHFDYTPVHLTHLITDYINVTADFISCKFQWIAVHCFKLQYPSNTIHYSQGPLPISQKDLPSSTKLRVILLTRMTSHSIRQSQCAKHLVIQNWWNVLHETWVNPSGTFNHYKFGGCVEVMDRKYESVAYVCGKATSHSVLLEVYIWAV